jgi:hypothetical protein
MSVPTRPADSSPPLTFHGASIREALAEHYQVQRFRVAAAKGAKGETTDAAGLALFPFWTPPPWPNIGVLSVDLDRPAAGLELHTAAVLPHVVIETPRGAQGVWFIDRVHTGQDARPGPLAYAEDVGRALRAALDGDTAVDPLRPSRVRCPGYASHDVRPTSRPLSKRWSLNEIRAVLTDAGQWPARSQDVRPGNTSGRTIKGRNDAVNTATWLTVRHALEKGTRAHWDGADVLAVAQRANREIAQAEGLEPLPDSEVRHMAASITRHQHRPGRRGVTNSETARALGAKGGAARSEAKAAAVTANAAKGHAVQSAEAMLRAESIRALDEQGYTHAEIARALDCSTKSVQRTLRKVDNG